MSATKLLPYKSYCFFTSAFISLLKVSNFDLSLLLAVLCFISSTNLPSYLRGCPRDRRYRPIGFRENMLISRLLNKGSYQITVLLNWAINIRGTIKVPIFCKVRRIFPHRQSHLSDINRPSSDISFFVVCKLSKFLRRHHDHCLSGECISWNWPGTEVRIKSKVFFSRFGRCTNCSFIMSINICPSDWLNIEPDLLSRSGEAIHLKLKSLRTWTEGSLLPLCLFLIQWRRVWMGLIDYWLMALFLLTTDFWPKILLTTDFCAVEFND